MSSYLDELNEVQRKAVTTINGPLMIVAGPGSGKTRVLTYRIAHLIESGAAPWEILALTFTNKSAREMKERIARVVGQRGDRVWAGTFHSIFAKILRIEASKIGFDANFTIYDSSDSKSLITNIVKGMNLDAKVYAPGSVLSRISAAKSNIIPPKAYEENQDIMREDRVNGRPYIYKIYAEYVKRCKQADAMDFDDLLYQLFILFYKNPDDVLDKYREKFKYILVDEFQDTNFLQYAIVKKLVNYPNSPHNICVVGDDAQSIYGFRGATIENILNFEKDYKQHGLNVLKLEQNYRSTHHIVQAANELIVHNRHQIKKEIWSNKGNGHKIQLIKAMTDNEEGRRVVDMVLEQKHRHHLRNKDIAILYRTNAQSRIFEENFKNQRIKYKIFGGMSFYQYKEIKDALAYLRLAVNKQDEEALRRVVNYPKRGIGDSSIAKVNQIALSSGRTLWDSLLDAGLSQRTTNALDDFKKMIALFSQKAQQANAYEAADFIIRQCGLLNELKADTSLEGLGRLENVQGLLDGIKEFVENDEASEDITESDRSLATYLQNIALVTDMDENNHDDDYVTLMSVHSSKGLEFPSIFVAGMEENLFPSFMALKNDDVDEERRLFYVAVTRAERFLTLSFANSRYKFGQLQSNSPSRFLEEISPTHLEGNILENVRNISETPTARVVGNFKVVTTPKAPAIDPASFKPSSVADIKKGDKVLHLRFNKGEVTSIDGAGDKRVATIVFEEAGEKRIMLKFANLMVVD
jgi:DNA helicase-2/ATP-dependent DNA helicase PcrA